jgi:CBS domain-containing protein
MLVREVYRPLLVTIGPSELLVEAARRMTSSDVGALAVWDGELEGIISERDLTRAMAEGADASSTRVVAFMSTRPYVVHPDDLTSAAAQLMVEVGIRHLPVVDRNEVVGMVSIRDLAGVYAADDLEPLPPSPGPLPHGEDPTKGSGAVKVEDVMTRKVVSVQRGTSFRGTAQTLLEHDISGVPVVDEKGWLLGMISETDLLPKESLDEDVFGARDGLFAGTFDWDTIFKTRKALALTAGDLMSFPVQTTTPGTPLREVARRMARDRIRRMPVVDQGKVVGILTAHDVLKAFSGPDASTKANIESTLKAAGFVPPQHRIEVVVSDGVATLSGTTNNSESQWRILGAVRGVDGVVAIRNQITFPR